MGFDYKFYKNKKVLVTGCTGFKGSWICRILMNLGAEVYGYSLLPQSDYSLFDILKLNKEIPVQFGDVRSIESLKCVFDKFSPEIVIHMAARTLVRESYDDPVSTYSTNVMGTVNVLECCRLSDSVRSVINVTTDKVYKNKESERGYRETDELNGYDPYSNSKSCSELVTSTYKNSFFKQKNISVSAVRSGNVIGGGDFAADRIIPDCVRAALQNKVIMVRNPDSVRPYQHVLEALAVYLELAAKQYENSSYEDCYNVGPKESDCIKTSVLVDEFCRLWGNGVKWNVEPEENPVYESGLLKLNCSKLQKRLDWSPKWNINEALLRTVDWYKHWLNKSNVIELTDLQIKEFFYCN